MTTATMTYSNDLNQMSVEAWILTAVRPGGRSTTLGVFANEEDGHKEAAELKISSNCTGFTLTPISFDLS